MRHRGFPVQLLAALLPMWTGCFPPPLEEVGKRCSAQRTCSEGLSCVEGRCASSAGGPVNLLLNGGFEEGDPPAAWSPGFGGTLSAERQNVRRGNQAARIQGIGAAELAPSIAPVSASRAVTYCLRVFIREPNLATLRIVEGSGGTGLFAERTVTVTADWQQVNLSYGATGNLPLTVLARAANGTLSANAVVDDAALWEGNAACSDW